MNLSGLNILTVGDVMLDHYITGKASRISPEAPVPVVSREAAWVTPGGAANVARGLARLGCTARLIGLAADDAAGNSLRQLLAGEGIEAYLPQGRSRPTTCKTRVMAGSQQLLRIDEEKVSPPSLEERLSLLLALEEYLPGCQAIILSDYAKGVLLRDHTGKSVCSTVLEMAKEWKIPVLVDPKGADWSRYQGAFCITPNLGEFREIASVIAPGVEWNRNTWPRLAKEIKERFSIENLLLTCGPDGMILYEKGLRPLHLPAAQRDVADVSGAGDTVIATLAAAVASGQDLPKSSALANTAAGIAVGKVGAAPVGIDELEAALSMENANPRLFRLSGLLEKIGEWRKQGKKIVFTNGCFDLIHPGHIALLRESAAQGDKLVVGLNSDASIRRLKGPERPIQNENSRALVLTALENVDAVILFDEDTPLELVKALKPDVLVKGSDYRIENIVGADIVQGYGGKVHLAKLVDGCSTTSLVQNAREKT